MAFIGNTVQTQGFTPAIDYFSGNASTVTFTLSRPVVSVSQMIVSVANVIQNPSSAYTVSGNSITFSSAPPSGTNNIWVEYTSLITTYAAISQSPSVIGDITTSGGFFAQGTFGNTYIDGTVVDYVTGMGRITAGPADGITLYNGGTSARTALAAWDSSGNLNNAGVIGLGTTPNVSKITTYTAGNGYGQFNYGNTTEDGANPLLGSYNNAAVTPATYGWAFYDSSSTGNLTLYRRNGSTTGNKTVEINRSNGSVTKPYQPYFYAYMSGSSQASNTKCPFDTAPNNVGSAFNTSTNTFTAPIAGNYFFTAMVRYNQNGATYCQTSIYVNGSLTYQGHYINSTFSNSTYSTPVATAIIPLNAGDTVYVFATLAGGGTVSFSGVESAFFGYLMG